MLYSPDRGQIQSNHFFLFIFSYQPDPVVRSSSLHHPPFPALSPQYLSCSAACCSAQHSAHVLPVTDG